MKVRMFVFNNCLNDARVLKEATSLGNFGHEVEIVAILDKKTEPFEKHELFSIHRIKLNPLHIRLIRLFSNPLNAIRSLLGKPKKHIPKVRVRRPSFLGRMKRSVAAFRAQYVNREAITKMSWYQKPFIFSLLILAYLVLRIIRVVYVFKRLYYRLKRQLKLGVIAFSRAIIQKPLRFLLLPYHKYFVYYDFYQRAVKRGVEHPTDVVHCHDLNTLKIGVKLKRETRCRLVYDSHELYRHKNRMHKVGRFKNWYLKRIEVEGMKLSDRVITVGECIADWLAKEYTTRKPEVVLNTPELRLASRNENCDLRKLLNVPSSSHLMVYSGSITFNRGVENIIRAVVKVPNLYFVMMGFSTDVFKQSLVDLIAKEQVGNRVSFYGPVPHNEVSTYLASADFGAAPIMNICLSYYFCSPNKLFEFVQASLPVIASNFPEMSKVVEDYEIGYTFDPADVDDIANCITKMISNKPQQDIFRANTKNAALRFQWKNEEVKLEKIYKELAS